ncbi:MAG: O-antigen ligase family protein [Chryseolinea sp.]
MNIRWIDIAIVFVIIGYLYSLTTTNKRVYDTEIIVALCYIYLIFESFQLYKSWGQTDLSSQISHFFSTLSLFIVIDLSTYALSPRSITSFLKSYAILGAVVVTITNLYLLYSFLSGNVVFKDLDIRVALEVVGSKETVYSTVLTPFVYGFGLYFIQKQGNPWLKVLFAAAILSIYVSLIITFYRGTFVMVGVLTIYVLLSSGETKEVFTKVFGTIVLMIVGYLIFGSILANKGYDPIGKIVEMAEFTVDVDNPDWDKGRSISLEYAIAAWKQNLWLGAGYDELTHYGFPEDLASAHNGFVTSLFHRGIVGTILLISILILLFKYAMNLWPILSEEKNYQNDAMKLLIIVSFLWIITFMTQEALWEKYSLCIQYLYLGLITNFYKQAR